MSSFDPPASWTPTPPPTATFRGFTPFLELRELRQTVHLASLQQKKTSGLKRAGTITAVPASLKSVGETRLARFLAVLRLVGTAPWANQNFSINEDILRRMVASHLTLIVGGANVKPELYSLVEQYEDWSGSQNLVWITNRQQGKTTTLSKFTAALAHMSCAGGQLLCIYSVSLDRAQEVLKGAKRYLYWLSEPNQASALMSLGATAVSIIEDNQRLVRTRSPYGSLNTVTARPKNPDSCRGDAPKAAIFDEIAFVSPSFWYQFSYPLLQVGKRVFTCVTTPPALGSFFAVFIDSVKEANKKDDYFFRLVNHSLACADCLEKGKARECTHNLRFIPPWKSLLRFTQMKELIPAKKQLEFEQEVYGVIKADGSRYFPEKLVTGVFSRKPIETNPGIKVIFIGVDPASHFRSFMGLAAVGLVGGQSIILGLESVSMARTDIHGMQTSVANFTSRVDRHPFAASATIIPVIEANASEVTALTILNTIKSVATRTAMPFTKESFAHGISDKIGIYTTNASKLASITHAYTAFVQLSIFTTAGIDTTLLAEQLCAFHDDPAKGPTGKTSAGGEDDLAMAFLIALYWGFVVSVRN